MYQRLKIYQTISLHPEAIDIPFKHKKEINYLFKDVLGLCHLDHISVDIVSPNEIMTYFSTKPALGYNLISQNLWKYDGCVSPSIYKNHSFYCWEDAYASQYAANLKKFKESEFGYTFGFILVRIINGFHIIYSFATKSLNKEIKDVFLNNLNDLLKIGDYCYNQIHPIFINYCNGYLPLKIKKFYPYKQGKPIDQTNIALTLKLVVNNTNNKIIKLNDY